MTSDLLLHTAITIGFTGVLGLSLTVTIHGLRKELVAQADRIMGATSSSEEGWLETPHYYVTCGGCGSTVASLNGVEPNLHNCDLTTPKITCT